MYNTELLSENILKLHSLSGASVPQVVQDIIKKFEKIVFFVFMCSGLNIYWAEGLNDKIAS